MAAEIDQFATVIRQLIPISDFSPGAQNDVIENAKILKFKKKETVFKQGVQDNYSYYVLDGELELLAKKHVQSTIIGGSGSARYAIAQLQPRQYSAKAKTPVTILRLDRSALDRLMVHEGNKDTGSSDADMGVSHIDEEDSGDWMTAMLQSELFAKLPMANIHQLFTFLEPVQFEAGDTVIKQGEPGDNYYIVSEGLCEVTRVPKDGEAPVKLAELSIGDSFGEEALLTNSTRNATITMLSAGVLMELNKDRFVELIKKPALHSVSLEQAKTIIDEGGCWIDVRFANEYEASHIESSINIPLNMLRTQSGELGSDKHYVVCCDTGGRSSAAAFLLTQGSFHVSYLEGGLNSNSGVGQITFAGTSPEVGQQAEAVKSVEEAKPVEAEAPERRIDSAVRASVLEADLGKKELEIEAADKLHAENKQADAKQKAAHGAERKRLEQERKEIEKQKNIAEQEIEKKRKEEEEKIKKSREKAALMMQKEKENLEEIYSKNTEEMKKLQEMQAEAEAEIRETREQLERQANESKRELAEAKKLKSGIEEEKKKIEQEAEKLKISAEEEKKRIEQEAEKSRISAEEEKKKIEQEAKKLKISAEEEKKKIEQEAKKLKSGIEEEKKRIEQEAEKQRLKQAELKKKIEQEAEKQHLKQAELEKKIAQQGKAQRLKQAELEKKIAQQEKEQSLKQAELEKQVKAKAKALLDAERRKLAEQFVQNNEEMEQAQKEKAIAEAGRIAAREEAQKIIEEYKSRSAEEKTEPSAEEKPEPSAEEKTEPSAQEKTEPSAEEKTEPSAQEKTEPSAEEKPEPSAEEKTEPSAEEKTEPSAEKRSASQIKLQAKRVKLEEESRQIAQKLDEVRKTGDAAETAIKQAEEAGAEDKIEEARRALDDAKHAEKIIEAAKEANEEDLLRQEKEEEGEEQAQPSGRGFQAEHIRRIKARAEKAKRKAQGAAEGPGIDSLFSDIASQLKDSKGL